MLNTMGYEVSLEATKTRSAPEVALSPPPNVAPVPSYPFRVDPGERFLVSGWFTGLIDREQRPRPVRPDLSEITVFPGDYVQLVYTEDRDRDGLSAVEERAAGTVDTRVDFDADGLSDYFEVREGWRVSVRGEVPYRVFPNPGQRDSDGDGLTDQREFELGTDPGRVDTDQDGYADGDDQARFEESAGPGPLSRDPIPLTLVADDVDIFAFGNTGVAISFLVVNGFDPLDVIEVRWDDPVPDAPIADLVAASGHPPGTRRYTVSRQLTRDFDAPFDATREVVIAASIEQPNMQPTVTCTQRVPITVAPNSTAEGLYVTGFDLSERSRCCTLAELLPNGACP